MQLSHALLISSLLHLLLALLLHSPLSSVTPAAGPHPDRPPAGPLTITLVVAAEVPARVPSPALPPAPLSSPLLPVPPGAATPAPVQENNGQRARFILEPDLTELEHMPLAISGKLRFSLSVSRLGRVEDVQLLGGGAVPTDSLAAIRSMLIKTRLAPAVDVNGQPVRSELHIVIGIDPGPEPLLQE